MRKNKLPIIALCIIMCSSLPLNGWQSDDPERFECQVLNNLQHFASLYPQHKVYLHTDKDHYFAGERIWFKAYGVALPLHAPEEINTNLYVELLNQDGRIVDAPLLLFENGLAFGDIQIPDSLHEGSYFLRAYTEWMKNFHRDFYFLKEIHIFNPLEENYISRAEIRENRSFNSDLEKKSATFQFAVFPEGGQLVSGLENRIAFKAANMLGEGVQASGLLVDEEGNKIVAFKSLHDGMGSFSFTPGAGKAYTAIVTFNNQTEKSFQLEPSRKDAYLLKANNKGDYIEVVVRTASAPEQLQLSSKISLIAQTRNRVYAYRQGELVDNIFRTTLPVEMFPDGICQITLFNAEEVAVAERLVFIYEQGMRSLSHSVGDRSSGNQTGMTHLTLSFDTPGNIKGSYSLAALASFNSEFSQIHDHIGSYFLLSGDLQGHISGAAYYLSNDELVQEAADLLMMTHGWKRYDWDDIAAGNFPDIRHASEPGARVSGKIQSTSRTHSFGASGVKLSVTGDYPQLYHTWADQSGRFEFTGLNYDNIFIAEISIDTDLPRRAYSVLLDRTVPEGGPWPVSYRTKARKGLQRGEHWSRTSRPDYFMQQLKPVPVSSQRGYFGDPDQVLYIEDLPYQPNNMRDILHRHIRSVTMSDENVYMRGPISIGSSSEPAFVIDGNLVDKYSFLSYRPDELERIEVISGAGAAILGVRGASGALVAYSKTIETQTPTFEFAIRGINTPSAFYESKIHTSVYTSSGFMKTKWWEPNIIPDEKGNAAINIPVNPQDKQIIIVVEGMDENGNPYFSKISLP